MKVAVISQAQTSGKTTFMALLGGIFSRSQNKNVAIMSTGRALDNIEIVDVKDADKTLRSMHVFQALLSSDAIAPRELFDYGYRAGQENVFIYDIFGVAMDEEEQKRLFMETLQSIPADLTMVEIKGDIHEPFNQKVLKACDVILYMFRHSNQGIKALRNYVENESTELTIKTGYVCGMYDRNVIGEKKLGTLAKMNARNILLYPRNSVIAKKCLDGNLDYIIYDIMKGAPEVIELRSKFLEVMQYMYDTDKQKYIRGIEEWFR